MFTQMSMGFEDMYFKQSQTIINGTAFFPGQLTSPTKLMFCNYALISVFTWSKNI